MQLTNPVFWFGHLTCLVSILKSVVPESARIPACLPCKSAVCPLLSATQCPVGMELEPCGCCFVCLRHVGEICGGDGSRNGVCGSGLFCSTERGNDAYGFCSKTGGRNVGEEANLKCAKTRLQQMDACAEYTCGDNGVLKRRPLTCLELGCLRPGNAGPCCGHCRKLVEVTCTPKGLVVSVTRGLLRDDVWKRLTLRHRNCTAYINETHALLQTGYTDCGTVATVSRSQGTVSYRNVVVEPQDGHGNKQLLIEVVCLFKSLRTSSEALLKIIEGNISGLFRMWFTTEGGRKLQQVRMFTDPTQLAYVAVVAKRISSYGLKVVVDSCFVRPDGKQENAIQLIDNRCPAANSVEILRTFHNGLWFSFRPQEHVNEVRLKSYIDCSVVICGILEMSGRCGLPKCRKPTQ